MAYRSETGAWVAFYRDRSGAAVFDDELGAHRYALSRHMNVLFVDYGSDIWEAAEE